MGRSGGFGLACQPPGPRVDLVGTIARILVVEDEAIVAMDLTRSLERLGHEVLDSVASAEQGWAAIARARPDLILMDIQLSGPVDGIDFAKRVRATQEIPVVFSTAHSDEATLARTREAAPYGYLVKPFTESALGAAISTGLRRRQRELERLLAERSTSVERTVLFLEDEMANQLQAIIANIGFALDRLGAPEVQALAPGMPSLSEVSVALGDTNSAALKLSQTLTEMRKLGRRQGPLRDNVGIDEALELAMRRASDEHGSDLVIETDLGPRGVRVRAQDRELVQCFTNLLVRAADALATQGLPRRVRVSTSVDRERITVRISRAGAMDLSESSFHPMESRDGKPLRNPLGLAYCMGVVASIGGTIESLFEAGQAHFILRLPIFQPPA